MLREDIYKTFSVEDDAIRFAGLLQEALADVQRRFVSGGQAGLSLTPSAIDDYLLWCAAFKRWRPETARSRRTMLAAWLDLLPERPLASVADQDMARAVSALRARRGNSRRYDRGTGLSAETVNKYMQALRDFIRWARDIKRSVPDHLELEAIPSLRIRGKLPGNRFPPRARVRHEFFNILKRLDKAAAHVADVLRGMLLFCRRPDQLFRLRWRDVHLPTRGSAGAVDFGECKGGCESSIPVAYKSKKHDLLLRCRDFWQRVYSARSGRKTPPPDEFVFCTRHGASRGGHGWTTSAFDHELARRCDKLGIHDFKSYDARRSVVVWLQQQPGVSPAAIQKFAGWMRVTTQEAYSSRFPSDGLPAMEAVEKLVDMPRKSRRDAPESGGAVELVTLFDDLDI